MTLTIMTSALEASGRKKYFFCCFSHSFEWFSTILDYIPFENAKKLKIGTPYSTLVFVITENTDSGDL
jgi:hypothetical protein